MQNIKKYFMTLALLLTAVTGAWADGISVTTEDFGKVICTDGSIYATVEDATAASKTAAAKIFFIDNVNKKGLALALADESGTMDWSTAKTTAAAHTLAVTGGTWKLATMDEWTNMRKAAKNYQNDEHNGHSTFKNMANLTQRYWVNTEDEYDSNNAYYYIPYSGSQYGFSTESKTNNSSCYVRACLEFNIAAPSGPEVAWNKVSKTGTFVMPGSNVELQVEYYPESNLFLGKEALADKANISVLNGETAVAFGDDGKSTATVTEGNKVTAKFTGKKVLGMKVAKKTANAYLKWDADQKKLVATEFPAEVTMVENADGEVNWSAGTYVVEGDVTINGIITLNGDVDLIIKDGAKLTAKRIKSPGSTDKKNFRIYGQANQSGQLVVNCQDANAILHMATFEVHGCQVKATSSSAGYAGFSGIGLFNVYGGSIDAECTASDMGSGIWLAGNGSMNIYGGDVKAVGKGGGNGIYCSSSTVTVYGGKLWAENATGIKALANGITLAKGAGFTGKIETSSDGSSWTEYTTTGTPDTKYVKVGY